MGLIIILVILTICLGGMSLSFGIIQATRNGWNGDGFMCASIACGLLAGILLIAAIVTGVHWHSCKYKAEVINSEYNTDYNQKDLFWAGESIEALNEVRKRQMEINGNLNLNMEE